LRAVRCSILQCVAVCCNVLPCVAVCCSVLQCVAVCCSVLQHALKEEGVGKVCVFAKEWGVRERCAAVYCGVLQCIAVCCSVLWCVAVCCSALQCVAVCCSVSQNSLKEEGVDKVRDVAKEWGDRERCVAQCGSVLQFQCVAVRCGVLQCVAECF